MASKEKAKNKKQYTCIFANLVSNRWNFNVKETARFHRRQGVTCSLKQIGTARNKRRETVPSVSVRQNLAIKSKVQEGATVTFSLNQIKLGSEKNRQEQEG